MRECGEVSILELLVKRGDGALKLLSPRGRVLDVLRVFRLLDVIPGFEDETNALASFKCEPAPRRADHGCSQEPRNQKGICFHASWARPSALSQT